MGDILVPPLLKLSPRHRIITQKNLSPRGMKTKNAHEAISVQFQGLNNEEAQICEENGTPYVIHPPHPLYSEIQVQKSKSVKKVPVMCHAPSNGSLSNPPAP